jgi:uncharacterized protein YlxW (UPF0749 family)
MLIAATSGADAAIIVALLIVFIGIPTGASMFKNPRTAAAARESNELLATKLDQLKTDMTGLRQQVTDLDRFIRSVE